MAALGRGAPAAVLISGEPGIGKTRLLSELEALGEERGCVVLSGSASELELDVPFWLFVDALDEYVAGLDPRRLASLEAEVAAELARVLPSLSEPGGASGPALKDERYRAHRAVRELLERLAATKPLLLLLDDVHWADPASVELLGALLRRPPGAAVLLGLTTRPAQVPERLAGALERQERDGSLLRLELDRLGRSEVGQVLGRRVNAEVADRLYEQSGGNPFYLEQLARSPAPFGGAAGGSDLASVEVPRAVAAALGEELSLLGEQTRTLLRGAAVAGDPFEPELAAAAAGVEAEAAMAALDELLSLDLIRTTEIPRRFRFRHPLVRSAVYEGAPAGWRLGAHGRCAAALAARGAPASARAHHVEQAATPGDEASIAVLCEAARDSAPRAPAIAARWLGAALRLLPESASQQRVELLLARAEALGATGRLEDGRADLLECIRLTPQQDEELHTRLTVACAGLEHMLGRHREARGRVAHALERAPGANTPAAVSLTIVLAFDGLFRTDFDAMREAAGRALELARALDRPSATAAPAAVLALACAFACAIPEALDACGEAAGLIDGMADSELARCIDAAAHLATAELYVDRFGDAQAHAERAFGVSRVTGQHFPTLVPTLATAYYMRGRLREAIEVIDAGVEAARLANNVQDIAWTLHLRSSSALAAGDLDTALSTAEEAVELTRELDESFVSAYPGLALAAARAGVGDAEGAIDVLLRSAGGEELPLIPGGWRTMGLELLAQCHLQRGRPDDAARLAELAAALAGSVGLPTAIAWSERAAAALALHAGDASEAVERALASVAAADEVGVVLEAAQSRVLAGRALAQAGDADRATAELTRAADDFAACGAVRNRAAAEQQLRKLGHRVQRKAQPGRRDVAGVDSLSRRELEVARLVVERRTNAEIAAELFLSLKTVESHMRNLFRKLEVSSRAEVARTVERADRAAQRR